MTIASCHTRRRWTVLGVVGFRNVDRHQGLRRPLRTDRGRRHRVWRLGATVSMWSTAVGVLYYQLKRVTHRSHCSRAVGCALVFNGYYISAWPLTVQPVPTSAIQPGRDRTDQRTLGSHLYTETTSSRFDSVRRVVSLGGEKRDVSGRISYRWSRSVGPQPTGRIRPVASRRSRRASVSGPSHSIRHSRAGRSRGCSRVS